MQYCVTSIKGCTSSMQHIGMSSEAVPLLLLWQRTQYLIPICCLFQLQPEIVKHVGAFDPHSGCAPRGLEDPGEMARRALTLLPGVLSALRILLPTRHSSCTMFFKQKKSPC